MTIGSISLVQIIVRSRIELLDASKAIGLTRVKSIGENAVVPDPATHTRLLDAAWQEADEHGIERLTLAGVGARAGVSRQAVYLHFGNRATLLVEMAARYDRTSGFTQPARRHPPPGRPSTGSAPCSTPGSTTSRPSCASVSPSRPPNSPAETAPPPTATG